MATDSVPSGTRNLPLTDEEATQLLQILESSLADTRVEVHHTHTPDFRDKVKHQEAIIRSLIGKLRQDHP